MRNRKLRFIVHFFLFDIMFSRMILKEEFLGVPKSEEPEFTGRK